MSEDTAAKVATWYRLCANPATDPFEGMAEAGLLAPLDTYTAIARTKAALIEYSGLVGLGGVWGSRQMVSRFFIAPYANDAQRTAWLGRSASVAISESGVGAHPKHLRTRAELYGAGYRITGEKAWVSNAPWAEVIIVFAITTEDSNGHKRYSAFLVPRDTPGLTMRDMPGFRSLRPARHCAVTLDDCHVPRSALLGAPGTAYERMALPFRDTEDAVTTFCLLGAFRWLLTRFAAYRPEATLSIGALAGLTAALGAASEAAVAALDAGRLATVLPTLIGVRVLAGDMLQRARTMNAQILAGTSESGGSTEIEVMLDDIETMLATARGPREARQAKLGASFAPA
jgi:acyl-CoA dehydrogenase